MRRTPCSTRISPPFPSMTLFRSILQRHRHQIERRDMRQAHRPASLLQPPARLLIDQGIEHQARIRGQILDDPVEMLERADHRPEVADHLRSEEHTSELQSLMRISYAVCCLNKNKQQPTIQQ